MTDNDQAGQNSHDHSKCGHDHDATAPGKPGETAVDPVCGMTVDLGAGKPTSRWGGTQYHFCSARCHDRFVADPYFYVSGNNKKKRPAAKKNALYTCPMDPEIVQEGPGTCPVCGMALEPMDGVSDEPNHELMDFTRRLWVSVVAAVPLMILTMGPMVGLPVRDWIGEHLRRAAGIRTGDTGGCVGCQAVFPSRLDIDQDLESQHVDADHDRRGGGLPV